MTCAASSPAARLHQETAAAGPRAFAKRRADGSRHDGPRSSACVDCSHGPRSRVTVTMTTPRATVTSHADGIEQQPRTARPRPRSSRADGPKNPSSACVSDTRPDTRPDSTTWPPLIRCRTAPLGALDLVTWTSRPGPRDLMSWTSRHQDSRSCSGPAARRRHPAHRHPARPGSTRDGRRRRAALGRAAESRHALQPGRRVIRPRILHCLVSRPFYNSV
jgi:hypothetical protein